MHSFFAKLLPGVQGGAPISSQLARDFTLAVDNFNLKTFALLSFAFGLLYTPIIISKRPLLDEMGRSMHGYFDWGAAGRPLADLLFRLVNLGEPAVSVYVLNQVIAIVFLAAAGTILAATYRLQRPLLAAIATFPLGANPYFLENMSMTFDSPLMAAGVLLAIASAATLLSGSLIVWIGLTPLLIVGSLSLYQPTASIFFIVAAFLIAKAWLSPDGDRATAWQMVYRGSVAVAIAVACYYIVLSYSAVEGAYAEHHSQICSITDGCRAALDNLLGYWAIVWSDWRLSPFSISALVTVALGLVALSVDRADSGLNLRSWTAIALLALVVILQYGLNLVLADPIWARRTFVSLGAVAALGALSCVTLAAKTGARGFAVALMVPVLIMDYSMLVVAHAVGAAMSAQKEFETSLVSRIIFDIEQLEQVPVTELAVIGAAPVSPVLVNTARKFPVAPSIVQSPLIDDWIWGNALFALNGLSLKAVPAAPFRELIEEGSLDATLERRSYCIFISGSTAIVAFRGAIKGC